MNYCKTCGRILETTSNAYCMFCNTGAPVNKTLKLPKFLRNDILDSCKMYLREMQDYNDNPTGFKDAKVYDGLEATKQLMLYLENL